MGRDRVDRDQQPVGSRIQILELLRDDLALASDVTSEIFRVRSPFPVDLTRLDGVASKGQVDGLDNSGENERAFGRSTFRAVHER